jgi:hypothetical protein
MFLYAWISRFELFRLQISMRPYGLETYLPEDLLLMEKV